MNYSENVHIKRNFTILSVAVFVLVLYCPGWFILKGISL